MKTAIVLTVVKTLPGSLIWGYVAGAVIALLILVYLVYSLIKPEKF